MECGSLKRFEDFGGNWGALWDKVERTIFKELPKV